MARLCSVLLLLFSALARANAVDVTLERRGFVGQSVPAVKVQIHDPIAGFWLRLERSDGAKISIKGGGRPGQTRTLDLTQPVGKFSYRGELQVNFPDAQQDLLPLSFSAELLEPLRVTLRPGDVDLPKRIALLACSARPAKIHVKVLLDTGKVPVDQDVEFRDAGNGKIRVTWPEFSGEPMKIWITAVDSSDLSDSVELSPWQIRIPHEEVNFDTGKWEIRPTEKAKIDRSHRLIADAVWKYGELAKLRLYIVGHTDTVASSESNRTLSRNRARSLALAFRELGLDIPIFYAGLGEDAPLVQTADETDEPRNRRAEYILSIDPPTSKTGFTGEIVWKKL